MQVAIIKPPNLGNSVRGVGYYAQHLSRALSIKLIDFNLLKRYDIVHFPYFDPFFLTLPPIRFSKTVVTVHDLTPLVFPERFPRGPRGELIWQIQKRLLQSVDAIITDSICSKNDIVKIVGIPAEKIHVVYLAADKIFRPIGQPINKFSLPSKFVLYVGGVNWNKNLPTLIRSCLRLKTPLVIVGRESLGENADLSNIENQSLKEIIQLAKNPLIHRLGFVESDDLVSLYNLATVYVQPSVYEGFGLPVLEAMACGTPVVCGKNSSLAEIVGNAAIFADVTDETDLAGKIDQAVKKPTPRNKLISQASKFSWTKTAGQTMAIYEKLNPRR